MDIKQHFKKLHLVSNFKQIKGKIQQLVKGRNLTECSWTTWIAAFLSINWQIMHLCVNFNVFPGKKCR